MNFHQPASAAAAPWAEQTESCSSKALKCSTHYLSIATEFPQMAGVTVAGEFFSFICEKIILVDRKLCEAVLQPLLESFSRGEFTRVKRMNLSGNEIGVRGAELIGQGLKVNNSLQHLDLSKNEIGEAGAAGLVEGLKVNNSLQHLDLQGQNCGPFGFPASSSLVRGCRNVSSLMFECFDWNACVASDSWVDLPVPPLEAIARGTDSVVSFVKAVLQGGAFTSRSCRVMVVGPQMVGKTSLINALKDCLSPPIAPEHRTVSVQVSRQLVEDGVDLRIWDFSGQENYYLSHSVHFTQRCLYILTWTPPQPAAHAGALSPTLTPMQLLADLRLWLQMLAQHVPKAKLVLVGTRDDGSAEYQSMRTQVEAAVDAEIEQLNGLVGPECRELQRMEGECQAGVAASKECWAMGEVGRRFEGGGGDGSDVHEQEIEWWLQQSVAYAGLEEWQQRIARQVAVRMKRAQMLRECIELMGGGSARLKRVASFTLDCLSGRGVAQLQTQLSGLCSSHVPGMGEQLPGCWLDALNALQGGGASDPMPKSVAIERIRRAVPALSSPEAQPDAGIWAMLQFWADLGRIFVYEHFVLPDPLRLLELIKPLLHHDPPSLMDDVCPEEYKKMLLPSCRELSSRDVCMGYLRKLKHVAVLDRRLLPLLPVWTDSHAFHETMLKFLAECHVVCFTGPPSDASVEVLVTARSRDLPPFYDSYPPAPAGLIGDDLGRHSDLEAKHQVLQLRFNAILGSVDACRVLFLVSRYHMGIMSRLQAFVRSVQPSKISLVAHASKDCLFMCRGKTVLADVTQACCAVRVLPSCSDVRAYPLLSAFCMNGGPLSRESYRRARCGVVVSSNDFALLTFMVRCVEDTLKQWSICADCQCWVQGPSDDRPFIQFDCPPSFDACALPLSAVLTGNAWKEVVAGVEMRDIFPRGRRCAMFLSYASNLRENTGTRHACEVIRVGFQEAALCSVWMECADVSSSRLRKVLVREGLQAANVYIVCLTPLYLTQPDCLTELNDILTLVETESSQRKRLIIMPLHPAMTSRGRLHIRQTKLVMLPDFQDASIVRKHILSSASLDLLQRLSAYDPVQDDPVTVKCLDTQPWLSTLPDKQPNVKWNGIEAMRDLCRDIVNREGLGLPSLLACADDKPLSGCPFLDERTSGSVPPSLEALSPDAAQTSKVDSVDQFGPLFQLFHKRDAIYLAERGVPYSILMDLFTNSSNTANMIKILPQYFQRIIEQIDFKYVVNKLGGCEDLRYFLGWIHAPVLAPVDCKVVFRVAGHDEKLLLHALFQSKFPILQRLSGYWSDFSYNCTSAVLKIWDRNMLPANIQSFVRGYQVSANLKGLRLRCLDLDDQNLKAFETRPKQRPEPERDLSLFTWRWGRAIENYLLPVTAPAALYKQNHESASKLTVEVFVTISRHFFPSIAESESRSDKLCGHVAFKWKDLIGAGWKAWRSLLQSADVGVHVDPDAKDAADSLRKFSIDLLDVVGVLVSKHDGVYGRGRDGSRADEWLMHLAVIKGQVRQGKYDNSDKSLGFRWANVDWKRACAAMLALPADKPSVPLNRGDADDSDLWFNLPAVCSFLANLCSCSWLGDAVDDPHTADRVKAAAASVLRLVQHALCVLLLGCDPAAPAPQLTLLASAECPCFLPLVREKSVARCLTCGREDQLHTLPQLDREVAVSSDFLVELCRVGSVGWQSRPYMEQVHGRTHLGITFREAEMPNSHTLYAQHVRPLLEGGAVDCECCRYLAASAPPLPDINVWVITDGKAKYGKMQPLLRQRQAEFARLCSHIELLIGAPPSVLQAVKFSERFGVHIHQIFDRRHNMPHDSEALVLWSNSAGAGLQKAVISTIRFHHTVKNHSADEFSEFLRESLSLLYRSCLDPVFFVPFKYYSKINVSRESDVDCELTCCLEVEQEYSDMHSLDDFRVLAPDGTVSHPSFPEATLRYIAVTVLKALALLPREVEISPGRKVAFEYSVLNPSKIMCSSDGCVKLAPPFFSPQSDCLDKNRFSAAKHVLVGHEYCNLERDYSSPDERAVSQDAWALAVTLIELRSGVPFKFIDSLETIKTKLNATDPANIPAFLWQEVAQSLKTAYHAVAVFSENFMLFLRSLVSSPSPFSTLHVHPWLSAQTPVQNLSSWFQSESIHIRPWLNQNSLFCHVQNQYCSRDAAPLAKFDGNLDMSNVCNIGDVNSSEWKHRGFPLIPPEIIKLAERNKSWHPIHVFLQDLSAFGKEPLSFVRIMMVGIGEVGKTRLVKALDSHEGKSLEEISPQNRTVAAQVSEFKLENPRQNRTLTACVWDFAGQVEYYMTHSLFMSERAIYMLLWKRPNQQQSSVSDEERAGIVMWLQMLAAAVPNARIVVVGTHRETPRDGESAAEYSSCYQRVSHEVHQFVRDQCAAINRDIKRRKKSAAGMELVHFADVDSKTGFGVTNLKLRLHSFALQMPFVDIEIPSSYNFIEQSIRHLNTGGGSGGGGGGGGGGHDDDDDDDDDDKGDGNGGTDDDDDIGDTQCEAILSRSEFLHRFREFQNRMLVRKYNKRVKEERIRLMKIRDAEEILRLQRAAGQHVDDDSLRHQIHDDPREDNEKAEVSSRTVMRTVVSADATGEAQDPRSEDGVRLQAPLQAPKSEPAPVALEAPNAAAILEQIQVQGPVQTLQTHSERPNVVAIPEQEVQEPVEDEQLEGAMLLDEDIWKGVLFWHELGIVYVRDSFVIIRPQCIVDFLKPLVHRDPQMMLHADPQKDPNNDLLHANVILRCVDDDSFEFQLKAVLARLKTEGAIHVSDLKLFDVWSTLTQQKLDFMLEFLQNHHVLQQSTFSSTLDSDPHVFQHSADGPRQLHVLARVHSNLISGCNSEQFCGPYQAFYIIREMHLDFLARVQSFLLSRQQFAQIELTSGRCEEIVTSKFCQGTRSGEIRMQPMKPCEIKRLFGTIAESVVADFSFMIVVSASDFGFFSLGVRCAELFLSAHSLFYPCWLKNEAGKVYAIDTQKNALSLHFRRPGSVPDGHPCLNTPIPEALVTNPEITEEPFCSIWGGVSDFCICHFTSEADGTRTFKRKFFELFDMLCTCSCTVFDQTTSISKELVDCFTATKAIIFLLTPAFLCSAECVSMLHLALQLGAHIVVIPLYPSVSHFSRQKIIQTGTVCNGYSTVDGRPQFFKLSGECICCLEGINQEDHCQHYDCWLKLRPWTSDFSQDWSSQGAYLTVSDFNDEHDPNGVVPMFASVVSRNSKYALMNLLCQELLSLFQPVKQSKKAAIAQEHSHKSMEPALPVDSPKFANSHRIFDKTCRQFLNELIAVGLSDEDVVQNCKLVRSSVVSGETLSQVASFGAVASPILLNSTFFSDAFRQIAKKSKIGLEEISCLPIEALSEGSDTSTVKSADSTRSLTSDSSTSLESLSFNSSSGSAQSLKSNASLAAIKSNCVSLFKSQFPKYATEVTLKFIEEKLTTLDEASLFLMTPEYLRPLEDCCGLDFVRCVKEVRRRSRAIPSFFDVRMDQIRSIVQEWNMELGDELGHGGFGKVFKCTLKTPKFRYGDNLHVAVKFVNFDKPARFFQEVSALSRLRHENIVPVFDIYPESHVADNSTGSAGTDIAAYSMQLLPSGDLRKLIAGHHRSYVSQVAFLSIAEQLLATLNSIHSKGHFHGDIKPENILWRLRSGNDFMFENVHILLSDFGLVKTRDPQLHLNGLSASTLHRAEGSFYYLSPEQSKGEGVYTIADDTWSAALVLAELMCRTNIKEARGTVDMKFLYKRCPLHLSKFVPAIHAALRQDRELRVVNPMTLLGCLQKPYYDVAVMYQPNSQNIDTGAAVELHNLFLQKGYYIPYICKIGKSLWQECEDALHATLERLGSAFEEVFAKLYVEVMTAMKSFVDKEKGGRVSHSSGTAFDEANDLHVAFKTQISQRIRDDQRKWCSMEVNTNMQILVEELEKLCRYTSANPGDAAAWLHRNSSSKCAFEMAKGCTGKVDGFHEAAVKHVVSYQDLDPQARCKICMNLLLFPVEARNAGKLLVDVRNKFLGHKKATEFSVQEYSEIMKCIDDLVQAFGKPISSPGRKPSDILKKECEIESICRSSFVIPILSDKLLLSWTKQDQNHYKESDVLLTQCNAVVQCLTSRELPGSSSSAPPRPLPPPSASAAAAASSSAAASAAASSTSLSASSIESFCPPDREHPHAGSSLRKSIPVFLQRSSCHFITQRRGIDSICSPCIERPYRTNLGVEKVLEVFRKCRYATFYMGSTSSEQQQMWQDMEVLLQQKMEARFQKQQHFCAVVCVDEKTKKAFSQLCPPDRRQTADVIELVVARTSGADLKCGDHLRKLNDDYVGQILDISENGHDHLSRPKVRLTVSCIREVRLNEGDQLFPVFCDQQKAVHADVSKATGLTHAAARAGGGGNATDIQDRVEKFNALLSEWTEYDWQEANQTRRPQLLSFFESNFSTFSESPPISALASAAPVAPSSDTKPSSSDAAVPPIAVVAPSAAKGAKSSHEKQREEDKKRELAAFLKLVFPPITVPSSDEEKQQNKLANEKRTKITDLLGLLEHKKNTGKEKKENQAEGGGGGGATAAHHSPNTGVPPLAPPPDSTPAPAPALALVVPPALAPAPASVSEPSPRPAFVPPEPLADSPAPAPVLDDRNNYAVVALLQQLGMSHLIPKFKEQMIDNKNLFKLTDDNLRALEVPIGKFSLFRDTWRGLARETSNSRLFACERFDRKAVLLKWDNGFITLGFGVLAHGSTREKTIARAIEENLTADDASKCLKIEGCSPRAVDEHEGRRHVMEVSFAPALSVPACFFAFQTAEMRDDFMKELQAQSTSGT